jgi:hypothetical protein
MDSSLRFSLNKKEDAMPQSGNGIPMGLKNTETAQAATAGLMNTRVEKLFSVS